MGTLILSVVVDIIVSQLYLLSCTQVFKMAAEVVVLDIAKNVFIFTHYKRSVAVLPIVMEISWVLHIFLYFAFAVFALSKVSYNENRMQTPNFT